MKGVCFTNSFIYTWYKFGFRIRLVLWPDPLEERQRERKLVAVYYVACPSSVRLCLSFVKRFINHRSKLNMLASHRKRAKYLSQLKCIFRSTEALQITKFAHGCAQAKHKHKSKKKERESVEGKYRRGGLGKKGKSIKSMLSTFRG